MRLKPEERRRRIIASTMEMIGEEGPEGLSLRAVARRCGMSTPGLMHHFSTLTELIRAVAAERDAMAHREIERLVREKGEQVTLPMLADAIVRVYYTDTAAQTRNFDALEAASFAPGHPAYGVYARPLVRPLELTRRIAERDYADPDQAIAVLNLLAEAMRSRWLRDMRSDDRWDDWVRMRDLMLGLLPRKAP